MTRTKNRALSVLLAVALVASLMMGTGMTAFAQEGEELPACSHEAGTHDDTCGYEAPTEGSPCANAEADPECSHEEDCGFVPAGPGQPCTHGQHSEACGGPPAEDPADEPEETEEPGSDAPALLGAITEFVFPDAIQVERDTPESAIPFPAEVTATVQPEGEGAQAATVAVGVGAWAVWSGWPMGYTPGEDSMCLFEVDRASLVLPEGVSLPDNAELPLVRVEVGDFGMEIVPMTAGVWGGSGTSSSPYQIADETDLALLATNVNNGTDYAGNYFVLTGNIALTSAWTPIGTDTNPFKGSFDGQLNSITGLAIDSTADRQGLFGYIDTATVKNLHASGNVSGAAYVGGVVGDSSNSTIDNCTFAGSVTGTGYAVGGVVGCSYGQTVPAVLQNCYNTSTVSGEDSAGGVIGSIAGNGSGMSATVQNCYNIGNVSGLSSVGGVSGAAISNGSGMSVTVQNCYNTGNVSGTTTSVGGGVGGIICLNSGATTVQFIYNTGNVSGDDKVGGVVGGIRFTSGGGTATVQNCISLGLKVTAANTARGRVVGDKGSGTLANNSAREDQLMGIAGEEKKVTAGIISNGENGDSVAPDGTVALATAFTGWSAWSIPTGNLAENGALPTLSAVAQSPAPTLPAMPNLFPLYYLGDGKLYKDPSRTAEYTEQSDKWSGDGKTLTLNGLDFTTFAPDALVVVDDITIYLAEGSVNNITSLYNGPSLTKGVTGIGKLTIDGAGTLNTTAGSPTNGTSAGILASTLIVKGGTTTATAGEVPSGKTAMGVDVEAGGITVSGGVLNGVAEGSQGDQIGVKAYSTFTSGSTIKLSGEGKVTGKSTGTAIFTDVDPRALAQGTTDGSTTSLADATWAANVYSIGGTPAKYVQLNAMPFTLHYNTTTGKLYTDATTQDATTEYTEQTDKWSGSGSTLTLSGFQFSTSMPVALALPAGVTLQLTEGAGANTIASTCSGGTLPSYGIHAQGDLTINGKAYLMVDAGAPTPMSNARGIFVDGGGACAISGGATVFAQGNYGRGLYAGSCTVDESSTLRAIGRTIAIMYSGIAPAPVTTDTHTISAALSITGNDATSDGITFTPQLGYQVNGQVAVWVKLAPIVGTAPTITTTSLPQAVVGQAYSQALAATGDTPITWALESGTLPDGLTLGSGGTITGTPTAAGTSSITVKATNKSGSNSAVLSLQVLPAGSEPTGPVITTDLPLYMPVSKDLEGITLFVIAENATDYQWYKNGEAMPGETKSSLTIMKNDTADRYYVVVTGANGQSVQSNTCLVQRSENLGNVQVAAPRQPGVPAAALPNPQALVDAVLSQAEKNMLATDGSVFFIITLKVEPAAEDAAAAAEAAAQGYTAGLHLNISLEKETMQGEISQGITPVTTLSGAIQIALTIPEGLRATGRSFAMVHNHNGTVSLLPDLDSSAETITFETSGFSPFALVYKDDPTTPPGGEETPPGGDPPGEETPPGGNPPGETPPGEETPPKTNPPAKPNTSPQTGDGSSMGLWLALVIASMVSLAAGAIAITNTRMKKNRKEN